MINNFSTHTLHYFCDSNMTWSMLSVIFFIFFYSIRSILHFVILCIWPLKRYKLRVLYDDTHTRARIHTQTHVAFSSDYLESYYFHKLFSQISFFFKSVLIWKVGKYRLSESQIFISYRTLTWCSYE